MSKSYYLSDGSRNVGPFSKDDLMQLLFRCSISLMDPVFDGETREWTTMMKIQGDEVTVTRASVLGVAGEQVAVVGLTSDGISDDSRKGTMAVPNLLNLTQEANWKGSAGAKPAAAPPAAPSSKGKAAPVPQSALPKKVVASLDPNADRWFHMDGSTVEGPFTFAAILMRVLEGKIQEDSLIRQVKDEKWRQARSCEEFSVERMRNLQIQAARDFSTWGGFKRQVPRVDVNEAVLVSDGDVNYHLWMGDISVRGCSLILSAPVFKPDQKIYLSIFPDLTAEEEFNAEGVVINSAQGKDPSHPSFKCSIRFVAISDALILEIERRMSAR